MNRNLTLLLSILISSSAFAQQEWSQVTSMPSGKHHPVTFTLDSLGYAVTGWDPVFGPTDDVYRYDADADEWETLTSFPGINRSFAIGYEYNNKGYIGFGANLTSYLRDIWEFDPESETWELVTVCPCSGRRHPAFLIHDDIIYVGLGDDATGDLNDWWMYDMNEDEWTQLDDLPALQRHHPFQFVVNDEVYVGFGHGGQIIYDDWYRYDYEDSSWVTLNDFMGEARVAGTQFSHDSFGYVLSGDGSNHSFMETGEFWQYNPLNDSWKEMPPHPGISLWAPGSFVIGDTVYLIGGENRQSDVIQSRVYKYPLKEKIEEPVDTTDTTTSVLDIVRLGQLRIYPNPVNSVLWIEADFPIESIDVYSITGQRIISTEPTKQLNVSNLDKGTYITVVRSQSGANHTIRFVKS